MLNLALYSDQIIPENSAIDARLLAMIESEGRGKRIAYIPSGPEPGRRFFDERKLYYTRRGLDLALFHDPVEAWGPEETDALFACDAIHLSGGHTGGFLQRLKHSGALLPLRDWALNGGILIGTSAGAILMTPTIATDALFSGGKPEDVQDAGALDLLPFEYFPHLSEKDGYLPELVRYSRCTPRPIVACNDGDGIVVTGGNVQCIGNPVWIADGSVRPADEIILSGLSILQKPVGLSKGSE